MKTYFDNEVSSLRKEILALKQAKAKSISQMKFAEFVVENVQLDADGKNYIVEPLNDVFPLLTARVRFVNGSIDSSWINMSWVYSSGGYRFFVRVLSASPVQNPVVDIIFTSTSELSVEEV